MRQQAGCQCGREHKAAVSCPQVKHEQDMSRHSLGASPRYSHTGRATGGTQQIANTGVRHTKICVNQRARGHAGRVQGEPRLGRPAPPQRARTGLGALTSHPAATNSRVSATAPSRLPWPAMNARRREACRAVQPLSSAMPEICPDPGTNASSVRPRPAHVTGLVRHVLSLLALP